MTFASDTNYLAKQRYSNQATTYRTFVAAAPFLACLLIPLWQVGGLFYFYDAMAVAAIAYLGFPTSAVSRQHSLPFWLLSLAIVISTVSGLLWAGVTFHAIVQPLQCLLAVAYSWMLLTNLGVGRVSAPKLATLISAGAVLLALVFIAQSIGFRIAPSLTTEVYRNYLQFSGFTVDFFDRRYLAGVEASGFARVMGTWDVTTTAAGMLAMATLWVLRAPISHIRKAAILIFIAVALAATGSRHSWILWLLIAFSFLRSVPSTRSLAWPLVLAALTLTVASTLFLDFGQLEDASDPLLARMQRTFQQGLSDSSFQLRYVDGTLRFFQGLAINPQIAVFGFGVGTEKALYTQLGSAEFHELAAANAQWGFVSNGWLLSIRNFGLAGFLALLSLTRRTTPSKSLLAAVPLFFLLIILADNYSVQVPRCMLLILATAAFFIAGQPRTASATASPK